MTDEQKGSAIEDRSIGEVRKKRKNWILFTLVIFFSVLLSLFLLLYLSLPNTSELTNKNPKSTALIEQRRSEAQEAGKNFRVRQKWVSFAAIPDMLKKSVRISEDSNFYFHQGIDFEELKESLKKNWEEGEFTRGGSTITQQLAKNLYLSTTKSIFRKVKEYFIARRLEKELSKNRIFHLYLNVIEFGPGIFGVEAAAQYYFRKSVTELNLEEIIRLTAVIPKPLKVRADGKSSWLLWRCRWILSKLLLYIYIDQITYDTLLPRFY
jgi:monofunctional biosynthetic peptidoglycan transglycosylase